MVKLVYSLLSILFIALTMFGPVASVAASTIPASLIFTEVKVRADTNNVQDTDEFIELFNAGLTQLPLNNYVIEYFNTANPTETQLPVQKTISDKVLAPGGQLVLAKQPTKIANSIGTPFSSLSDTGGRLRLVTAEGDIIDEIGWTNSASSATTADVYPVIIHQCNTSNVVCNANRIQSISRQSIEGLYVLDHAMWRLGTVTPLSNELLFTTDETVEESTLPEDTPVPIEELPIEIPTCEGIMITELLPNADGSDTNKEFIELFNPTDETISLRGCSLQISSSSKVYQFQDVSLAPQAYSVFTDQITGLTMPNAAGGTVWLLTAQKELQTVVYPADLDEDEVWASFDSTWQASYMPSPGGANVLLAEKPCIAGQERNLVTGDCQKIVTTAVATITPCKVGQERNPDTNRCRSIIATAALIACKSNQERNPETNRCKAVNGASVLLPCDEGQERNPETNRCRKVADVAATNIAKVTDVVSPSVSGSSKLWLLIAVMVLILGYAVYEWRQDVVLIFRALISKLHR